MERIKERFIRTIVVGGVLATIHLSVSPVRADNEPTEQEVVTAPEVVATPETEIQSEPTLPESIPQLITRRAIEEGLDPRQIIRIALCESKLDPNAPRGGLFQFVPTTWAWAQTLVGRSLEISNPLDNTDAALAVIKAPRGGFGHWACK